ncbi:hypothetical protein AG1IA_01878 [Rhizoctonia solani AG-1 IA]|uniref:Uncharacterized protein n=1 Tax=Thanatephorus cucumeris (strain AG1-IA) TaxID=983506 RepID=L8X1I8_THACA|nr:hypothetical protein AG1IA_01878 [Rhizoctonia solani AG-1 IA]
MELGFGITVSINREPELASTRLFVQALPNGPAPIHAFRSALLKVRHSFRTSSLEHFWAGLAAAARAIIEERLKILANFMVEKRLNWWCSPTHGSAYEGEPILLRGTDEGKRLKHFGRSVRARTYAEDKVAISLSACNLAVSRRGQKIKKRFKVKYTRTLTDRKSEDDRNCKTQRKERPDRDFAFIKSDVVEMKKNGSNSISTIVGRAGASPNFLFEWICYVMLNPWRLVLYCVVASCQLPSLLRITDRPTNRYISYTYRLHSSRPIPPTKTGKTNLRISIRLPGMTGTLGKDRFMVVCSDSYENGSPMMCWPGDYGPSRVLLAAYKAEKL